VAGSRSLSPFSVVLTLPAGLGEGGTRSNGAGQSADSVGRPTSLRSWLDPLVGESGPREPRCASPLRGFSNLSTDPRASISQRHAESAKSSSTPSTPSPSRR
jgi:hypothetical protein